MHFQTVLRDRFKSVEPLQHPMHGDGNEV